MAAVAGPAPAVPVFQIRLVVAEGPESTPPKDAEKMILMVTNSAAGLTGRQFFWVEKTVLMDQDDLQSARVVTSSPSTSNVPGRPEIEVTFTPKGRKRFAEVTRHNINKRLAILINGRIISAPVIRSEISGGTALISGNFTEAEASELSNKINQALKR